VQLYGNTASTKCMESPRFVRKILIKDSSSPAAECRAKLEHQRASWLGEFRDTIESID